MWKKINADEYIEIKEIKRKKISKSILGQEIKDIQKQINELLKNKLDYPSKADEKLKTAIDLWNEENIYIPIIELEAELDMKKEILSELENE